MHARTESKMNTRISIIMCMNKIEREKHIEKRKKERKTNEGEQRWRERNE